MSRHQTARPSVASGASGSHAANSIHWTRGKGVIGTCWDTGDFVVIDTSEYSKEAAADPVAWDSLPPAERLGISSAELRAASKYGVVAAHPILDREDGVFRGCVSLDGPAGCQDKLSSTAVEHALAETAEAIRRAFRW